MRTKRKIPVIPEEYK